MTLVCSHNISSSVFYKHSPLFLISSSKWLNHCVVGLPIDLLPFQYYCVYAMGIGGQRGRGRPKSRWIDVVEEEAGNLEEIGWQLPRIEVAGNVCKAQPGL